MDGLFNNDDDNNLVRIDDVSMLTPGERRRLGVYKRKYIGYKKVDIYYKPHMNCGCTTYAAFYDEWNNCMGVEEIEASDSYGNF